MTVNTHRHQTFKPYTPRVIGFTQCVHIWGKTGLQCERAPEKGRQYCKDCRDFLTTLTDRVPPDAATEPHPWRKPMKL